MIFFGHIGISIGAVHAADRIFHHKSDLRKVALVSILPDIIDKPVVVAFAEHYGNHSRIFGHSLMVSLGLLALLALVFRQPLRNALVFWGVYVGHFVLDAIWRKDLHALFWPFMAWPPPDPLRWPSRWLEALLWPPNLAGEVLGIAILIWLARRYRLLTAERAHEFMRSGLLLD